MLWVISTPFPPEILCSSLCPSLVYYAPGAAISLWGEEIVLPLKKIFPPLKMQPVPDEKNPRYASDLAPSYKNSYFLPKKMCFQFLTKINKNPQEKNIGHCYLNVGSPVLVCSCQLEIHCERRRVCYTQPSPHQPL